MSTESFKGGLELLDPSSLGTARGSADRNFRRLGKLAVELGVGPPGPADDSDHDFAAGSLWYDTTGGQTWVCTDARVGAAAWTPAAGGTASDVANTLVRRGSSGEIAVGVITTPGGINASQLKYNGFDVLVANVIGDPVVQAWYFQTYSQSFFVGPYNVQLNSPLLLNGQPLQMKDGGGSGGGTLYMDGGEVNKLRAENAGAAPSGPNPGQIYFDTGDSHFHGYNGSSWVRLD